MGQPRVYLDWNATTPPLEEVIAAMACAARDAWANPSSTHGDGRRARSRVEAARAGVAELVGGDPRDVVFTSGGTEANNLGMRAAFAAPGPPSETGELPLLATSRLEHPSVTRVAEALEREGRARVHWLAVREDGQVDEGDLAAAIAHPLLRLVALQQVNHETGVLQPTTTALDKLAERRARGLAPAWLHVDCVQAAGKLEALVPGADSRAFAAHKFRGPKGIGALVVRAGAVVPPLVVGGGQERGVRPGTVDPVAASGFEVAARRATSAGYASVVGRRDRLEAGILACVAEARVNGGAERVAHVTNVSFPGWNGAELVAALDLEGISTSSGSACSAGTIEPSPGIEAMVGRARAACAIRFSLGPTTTDEELERALLAIARVLKRT